MTRRNQSLDVLRGVAVLLVIANHYPYYTLAKVGWIGVDLFFVLSGFLISGLLYTELLSQGSISLGRFFVRRGLKIYPAFYFFLGLTALMSPGIRHSGHLLTEAFFLQSYLPRVWGHTWSLAIEEHFYIMLPLLLIVLNRRNWLRYIPAISVSLILGCLAMRIGTGVISSNLEAVHFRTHLRMDALFAGVMLGYLYHLRRDQFRAMSRWWVGPAGVFFLLPSLMVSILSNRNDPFVFSVLCTFNLAGFALIVLWSVTRTYVRCGPLEEIGRYSYSIYLWHVLVSALWHNWPATFLTFWADLVSSLAVGVAMALMVEAPTLHLRDKFFPSHPSIRKHAGGELAGGDATTVLAESSA
jgi:peptidoglycan/LPS O-acetylase OafA/YrhL